MAGSANFLRFRPEVAAWFGPKPALIAADRALTHLDLKAEGRRPRPARGGAG